jgi:predicted dehydrogenase
MIQPLSSPHSHGAVVTEPAPTPGASIPRIAVIGCGAIARTAHLPALVKHPELVPRLVLVDHTEERARALADEFGIPRTATDYAGVLADVDGVVVTVPHHLHYRISMDCLRAGKHVLCEKPLAESPAEAREMIAAAEASGVTLSVNHTRRLYPSNRRVHQLVREGAIGKLRRIQFFWGEKFDWPAASGFYFGVGGAPHGVMLDKGPHALDLVCWWLGGKPEVVSVLDDSFGGGEAMISLALQHESCVVDAQFSFLSRYPNTFTLEGDSGRIEGSLYDFRVFDLVTPGGARRRIKLETPARSIDDFAFEMMDNFLAVIRGTERPLVPATDILDNVILIDECYARRQRYDMPWHECWRRVANA